MIRMFFRLLPSGPQKDAAMHLVATLEADPNSLTLLTTHLTRLRVLLNAVQEGTVTPAEGLATWLNEYLALPISAEVRQAVTALLQAISLNPNSTNAAVGPVVSMVAGFLPG